MMAAPVQAQSWSGAYGGASAGYGTGHSNQSDNGVVLPNTEIVGDGHYNVSGGFVGLTLGYNWQSGPLVFGIEGDYSFADIYGGSSVCGTPSLFAHLCSTQLDAFGTLRGRIGYAMGAGGWVLPYVTGGAAVGHVRGFDGLVGAEGSVFRPGWAAGVGFEAKFAPQWSAKLEYLHLDLGSAPVFEIIPGTPETVSFRADMIRAGVNYAFGAPVAPARMYTKAPVIAPVANWTGFYVGADLGGVVQGGNGQSNFFQNDPDPRFANLRQNQLANGTSFLAALHAGYNWQFAKNLVLGVEADGQWQKPRYVFCRETDVDSVPCFDNSFGYSYVNSETRSMATVRGRLGFTWDRLMLYGTGGAAFTRVDTILATDCRIAGCANSGGANFTVGKFSSSLTGWVAGGGIEWMLANNWLARAEYLHADFGTLTNTLLLDPAAQCAPAGACGLSWSRQIKEDIVRVGVSYKFDPSAAVIAKY
jgi:outer membrane immunogenic protein